MFMKTFVIVVSIPILSVAITHTTWKIDFEFSTHMFFDHFPVHIGLCIPSTDYFMIYLIMTLWLKIID